METTKRLTPEDAKAEKPAKVTGGFATCEECGAPLDEKQRYCVSCGARRRDRGGPAVQYFASAGRRTRRGAPRQGSSGARAAAVLFFVVLPIAVAIGVLVGKGNGGNNDQDLVDAIKSLQASGGGNTALASTAASTPISSDFTLDKGYTVELKTLPVDGTDQAAADAAKKQATDQGASDVGIINTSDFTVTPGPPASTYVLYSGQFKTKGEATKALGKLKSKFPDAQVVSVKKNTSGEGKLVSKTAYGDVHKVEGFTPSAQKVASDTALVNQESQKTGKNYVDSQKDLPDVIVVGGNGGGSSNPAAQGNGD
jgi:SPOR domain